MVEHLHRERRLGGYEAAHEMLEARQALYSNLCHLLAGRAEDYHFVESATQGLARFISSYKIPTGSTVVCGAGIYDSAAIMLTEYAAQRKFRLYRLQEDALGRTEVEDLERCLRDSHVSLVLGTHVSNYSGIVHPVVEMGRLCAKEQVPFVLDACQTVGYLDMRQAMETCDVLLASGRKFLRGPRGSGFIWTVKGIQRQLRPSLPDDTAYAWAAHGLLERKAGVHAMEYWERSVAAELGLSEAVAHAGSLDPYWVRGHVLDLAVRLRNQLCGVAGLVVNEPIEEASALVTVSCSFAEAEVVKAFLGERGVVVDVIRGEPARVGAGSRLRLSPHYFNTVDDVDRAFATLVAASRALSR